MDEYDGRIWWDVQLRDEQWAAMPSTASPWQSSTPERERRLTTAEEISEALRRLMPGALTARQRQVMELYYFENRTQAQVAAMLGISQPTVSQHLRGKARNGSSVGGAHRRMRKAIRRAARKAPSGGRGGRIVAALDRLLDEGLSRRRFRAALSELSDAGRQSGG